MAEPFRVRRRVEFCDTDMAGIIHFSNYFRYMESAEVAFLRARGLSVAMEWEGQAIGFPRVSASCDFLRPAKFEDELDILVRLTNLGRKSVTYGFEFLRGSEVMARGQVSAVCCRVYRDAHRIESIEIPDGIRAKLTGDGP